MIKVSDSVDLEWGLRTCVSNRFPSDAEAPGPEILRATDFLGKDHIAGQY